MKYSKQFDGMTREQLEAIAGVYLENLTLVQERCNSLLEENRKLKEELQELHDEVIELHELYDFQSFE